MAIIKVDEDCGNSPRKLFLKDLNIAFAKGDLKFVAENIPDEIRWEVLGDRTITGKHDFLAALQDMNKKAKVKELQINKIITHGTDASANGMMTLNNGERYAFCDVYEFKGAKGTTVKTITSYVIPL